MPSLVSGIFQTAMQIAEVNMSYPPKTFKEMKQAQKERSEAITNLMGSGYFYGQDNIQARAHHWRTQIYHLIHLLSMPEHQQQIETICNNSFDVNNREDLKIIIKKLYNGLETHAQKMNHRGTPEILQQEENLKLDAFIQLLNNDQDLLFTKVNKKEENQLVSSENFNEKAILFTDKDIINVIKEQSRQGRIAIVNNAANAFRDGASKYNRGSLEELLSRFIDVDLKMALHFDDVHQRNINDGVYAFDAKNYRPKSIDVKSYQRRYLRMVLNICYEYLDKGEAYFSSETFYENLFQSENGIYHDLQSNAYEVPSNGVFVTKHWFSDTSMLKNPEQLIDHAQNNKERMPITIVSYAAPDRRYLKTSPLDAYATSNIEWQNPWKEGQMGSLLDNGIKAQFEEAVRMYKKGQASALVFVMPGCGAFNNPEKSTAAHFISLINYYAEVYQINDKGIPCIIDERNNSLLKKIQEANLIYGLVLGELTAEINKIQNKAVQKKAIAVKESIVEIISQGVSLEDREVLIERLAATTELLKKPNNELLIQDYVLRARSFQESHTNNGLLLPGYTMVSLGVVLLGFAVALGSIPGVACCVGGALFGVMGIWYSCSDSSNRFAFFKNRGKQFADSLEQSPIMEERTKLDM